MSYLFSNLMSYLFSNLMSYLFSKNKSNLKHGLSTDL